MTHSAIPRSVVTRIAEVFGSAGESSASVLDELEAALRAAAQPDEAPADLDPVRTARAINQCVDASLDEAGFTGHDSDGGAALLGVRTALGVLATELGDERADAALLRAIAGELGDAQRSSQHRGKTSDGASRPEVVVLCGSTRFGDAFREANLRLTLAGKIVLSIGCDMRSDGQLFEGQDHERIKADLDELHKRKVDLADRVLVLNVGGYIGESTRSEIAYATAHDKPIDYLEPWRCKGEHASRSVKYLGPLMIEICDDPQCAKLCATCSHPKSTWNADGTVLTCDFCGVDGT